MFCYETWIQQIDNDKFKVQFKLKEVVKTLYVTDNFFDAVKFIKEGGCSCPID